MLAITVTSIITVNTIIAGGKSSYPHSLPPTKVTQKYFPGQIQMNAFQAVPHQCVNIKVLMNLGL